MATLSPSDESPPEDEARTKGSPAETKGSSFLMTLLKSLDAAMPEGSVLTPGLPSDVSQLPFLFLKPA